jgi:glutathione synthase/RimK-type ligase-like ATP-grasp enzyme
METELGKISPPEISHVWLRRPHEIVSLAGTDPAELRHTSYEWSEAVEGFLSFIPERCWMNHPAKNVAASHKVEQLIRARSCGLSVPLTLLTQSEHAARQFWENCGGQMIVKPLASGFLERKSAKGNTNIFTSIVQKDDLKEIGRVVNCPTLFQEQIKKTSDIRICVIDNEMHAVQMLAPITNGIPRLDIRRYQMRDVQYKEVRIPLSFEASLRALIDTYKLRFAAVDAVVNDRDEWIFLEINPNGQWAWLDLEGGFDVAAAFVRAFS